MEKPMASWTEFAKLKELLMQSALLSGSAVPTQTVVSIDSQKTLESSTANR